MGKSKLLTTIIGLGTLAIVSAFGVRSNLQAKPFPTRAEPSEKMLALYPSQFDFYDRRRLFNSGVMPAQARAYDNGVGIRSPETIIDLARENIEPKIFTSYPKRFDSWDRKALAFARITPETSALFDERFNGWFIAEVISKGKSAQEINSYAQRFNQQNVEKLIKANLRNAVANQYQTPYAEDVVLLTMNNISPEQANPFLTLNERYNANISGRTIISYLLKGISLEEVTAAARKAMVEKSVR